MRFSKQRGRTAVATVVVAAVAAMMAGLAPWASGGSGNASYEPVLDPAKFSTTIDNRYYPLPVGRVLTYKGVRDGELVRETITVTGETKVGAEGIWARVVKDVLM